MKTTITVFLTLLFVFSSCKTGQKVEPAVYEAFPINRGVNISHWLSQSKKRGEERAQFFTQKDVQFVAAQGYDHIRMPVDEEQLWDKEGNKEPEAFALLHQALGWADEAGIAVIVDLHIIRSHHFNNAVRPLWTDPAEQEKFIGLWKVLSGELKGYPLDFVAYELMNEAVADDPDDWNKLIAKTMTALRELEPKRKIVIGSNMWQQVQTFKDLVIPENDPNIILSFHYYTPFPLTHHQASWTGIYEYDGPVQYPGEIIKEEDLEGFSDDVKRELSYHRQVYTKDTLESLIMLPVKYAKDHGLQLYCGEWGCLPTVTREMRMLWYSDVRSILEKHGIAWAHWDYKGGFGIIDRGTGEVDKEFIRVLLGEKPGISRQ
ncbi:MAG: cellulase family glycosylhydrolase [Bacteroidales bacterium]|nr:cellulase family glycosylhydrolase [Bacteroidales bacterium]